MRGRADAARPRFRPAVLVASLSVALVAAAAIPAAAQGSITGFSPTHGPPGTTVVISGTGFTGSSDVRFGGASAPYAVDDDGRITASVPAGATTGPIEVDTPDGTATSTDAFTVDEPAGPSITGFSPTRGPEAAPVVIDGTGLLATTDVRFGDTPATFSINTDDRLTAYVPSGATTAPITVTSAFGTATTSDPFVVEPNVVVIVSDDQRYDEMSRMPNVQSQLVDRGVTFQNGFVSNPLCCPSRVSILTGQDSGTDGVWSNAGAYGGFSSFRGDGSTIATWLDAAGYDTALVGKYLNAYGPGATYIPPGWDRWVAFNEGNGAYYDYDLKVDDQTTHFGSQPADYSTDVLAGFADQFIRDAPPDQALFLYFTPYAPHGPSTPPPRYDGVFSSVPGPRPPSYNEADVSDKPAYIRSIRPWSANKIANNDAVYRHALEALLGLDDAVGRITAALRETGRLDNTVIVYLSDNGSLNGEHRWGFKVVPYDESIRVPFVVRWDRLPNTPRTDRTLAANLDVAPTIADAAGVAAPGVDGVDLMPALAGTGTVGRQAMLIESLEYSHHNNNVTVPSYCGIRTRSKAFVHYATGEEEYYALGNDPYELKNRARAPSVAATVKDLRAQARALCDPRPPGMPSF